MRSLAQIFKKFYSTAPKRQILSSSEYCLNLIKQYDYENFLTLLLLDQKSRNCAIAIRSFNVEVSRIPDLVSEKTIGMMRLKFWEDAVDSCYNNKSDKNRVPDHPVVIELYKAVNANKLTKRHLKNLIYSRRDSSNQFHNLEELENYAEKTVSTVYYLILEGSSIKNLDADHAASHLGKSQGIVQLLRTIPHANRLGFISLPKDILVKHKVSEENIIRGENTKELSDSVFEVATKSHQHLMKFKSLHEKVSKDCRKIFLSHIIVESYLNRLQNVDYNVFHPSLRYRSWKLMPQLWYNYFKTKW